MFHLKELEVELGGRVNRRPTLRPARRDGSGASKEAPKELHSGKSEQKAHLKLRRYEQQEHQLLLSRRAERRWNTSRPLRVLPRRLLPAQQ